MIIESYYQRDAMYYVIINNKLSNVFSRDYRDIYDIRRLFRNCVNARRDTQWHTHTHTHGGKAKLKIESRFDARHVGVGDGSR